MPPTHTADFQTAALKATDLDAVEKVNVGLETELVKKHVNIIADAPEIRIQDKTGSAPEVNATTMAIVADGGTTHFRAGTTTFAEGSETKGDIKFQSSTGATTHAEIVGSSGTLELQDGGLGLKLGSNVSVSGTPSAVIQEITGPHARESAVLKKYPEVSMRDYTYNGYTVSSSSDQNENGGRVAAGLSPLVGRSAWCAFDDSYSTFWQTYYDGYPYNTTSPFDANSNAPVTTDVNNTQHRGHWIKLKLPVAIKLQRMTKDHREQPERWDSVAILGSNDDTNWHVIKEFSLPLDSFTSTDINSDSAYTYILLIVKSLGNSDTNVDVYEIGYYGYEEVGAGNDSVDTTVKSVFNAPDLTSAALYIDGKKSGSTPTDYGGSSVTVTDNGTWDSSDNTWSLSGTTTSNVVSGNLASLVGDHPHTVSAWVKADRLNGDGLFHVGTAEGEGDAASRVGFVDDSHISWGGEDHFFSNTEWHNVTYTYNGEGSDKKLYLDGRHIGTAKNEDTFGDYPPFAMTDYRQYGYVVSASSSHPNYPSRYAFNDSTTHGTSVNIWITDNGMYNASGVGTPTSSADTTVVDGTNQVGEWLQIELPHQLKVSYMDIAPQGQNAGTLDRAPKDGIIAGSRDGSTWETMKSWTGVTDWALTGTSGVYKTFVIDTNTHKAYKYIRIIIKKTGGNDAYGALSEVKIFGHRENDLVRFPDPTNVLKYPHVAMSGPAQRGYVASASSQYHDGNYPPYNAFNNIFTGSDPTHTWNSKASAYHTSSDGQYNGSDNFSTTISGTAYAGEWIQIELPRKVVASVLKLGSYGTSNSGRSPRAGAFAGSNDGSTWDLLKTYSGETSWTQGTLKSFAPSNNTTTAYKYFRFVITRVQATNDGLTALQAFEVHGTEEDVNVIARVGDGFDGKVRNLRVYSTALSDARVQEIFDADKDEFGLAKSSISVYRGHLGVGTDKPKAALTVMDEIAELGEFPPKPMMAAETYMEGHGNFKACASSYYGTDPRLYQPYAGFKRSEDHNTNWSRNTWNSVAPSYNTTTKQVSSGASLGGYSGEWLKLSLPYGVKLSGYQIMIRSDWDEYGPGDWVIIGSNDDTTWHLIASVTAGGITGGGLSSVPRTKDFVVETTKYYKHLALVCSAIHGTGVNQVNFTGLRYFGTREQGASTLHNGELSLTRNLTVPRIGPSLDADDTPRRDRLVVEYNTSTNPTENAVVKDTSGRGLDGLTYNGASYSATEKALVFDGSNDYVFQNDVHLKTGVGGVYSASVWVRNRASSGTHTVYSLGTYAQLTTSTLYVLDTTLQVVFYNSDLDVTYTIPKNTWTNIVVTHGGGQTSTTTKMYINGVDVGLTAASGTSFPLSTVNFPSPCNLFLGKNSDNSVYGGPMDLSNFKLWDTELSAEDAKRLYDMGRLGNVIAKPLYVTAPLHAPGTVVQVVTNPIIGQTSYTSSSGADVNLAVLQTSITPKFSNSKMVVQVYMSYEADYNAVLFVRANDADIPSGRTYGSQEGTIPVAYDSNRDSTPNSSAFVVHHNVSSTQPVTYKVFYKVNGSASGTIRINRAYSVVDEKGMCYVVIWEIAQ